jgi:hypothetical protein
VDGTPHQGFWVGEGAYESYARNIDPVGDEVRGAACRSGSAGNSDEW